MGNVIGSRKPVDRRKRKKKKKKKKSRNIGFRGYENLDDRHLRHSVWADE